MLAVVGLLCVTVLAALHDIGGDTAMIVIVSILGSGGVSTAITTLSGGPPRAGSGEPGSEPPRNPAGG